jgi:murein L,D-transpeptidase YcbB/YkuD
MRIFVLPLPAPTRATKHERGRILVSGLFRASALLIAVLSVAACASTGAMRAPDIGIVLDQEQAPTTQSILRSILLSGKSAMESGSPSQPDRVLAFYEARNFQPAWTGGAQEDEMAGEVRAALARAHEQGLNDEDYKLAQDGSSPAPGAAAAQYDIALTDALFRYSRDVRTGRVRPNDIYDDVILPAPRFGVIADLTHALGNHAIAKFLADLPPLHPEYRELAKALSQYRAIAEGGGWPSVPGENEIKLGSKEPRLNLLVKRLAFEDSILAAIANPSTAELRDAVKRFQARNGLHNDGRVTGEMLAALNVPASFRAVEIAANMERWRWMPREFERRYVAVNVPDQSLEFVRDGAVALTSRVIVGRKTSATPITRSTVIAVVANPPWNIPGDIAARDLLPLLRHNPNYLASKNMVVTNGPAGDPHGRKIDWRSVTPAEFPYAIRQLPGPNTVLGALMLDSPNDFDVYLHDTPDKKRFAPDDREISNGCVRVQQIFPLASLALTDDAAKGMERLNQAAKSHQTQRLTLDSPLPVYFLYWTALPGPDGMVGFRPDLYDRDTPLIAALTNSGRSAPMYQDRKRAAPPTPSDRSEADEVSP